MDKQHLDILELAFNQFTLEECQNAIAAFSVSPEDFLWDGYVAGNGKC